MWQTFRNRVLSSVLASVVCVAAGAFQSNSYAGAVTDPALSSDFINFGYIQNSTIAPYLQYEALTHIAPPFVNFLANGTLENPGTFTNRSSDLKAGGAAARAGTKIVVCVRNFDFNETILNTVMQDPARRTTLVNAVRNLVVNDGYCAGVNFDFEFAWGAATRDGISAFISEMRSQLPADKEISIYTHATYSATRWDMAALVPNIDYMLYSTYDWGSGSRAHATSDFDNCIPNIVAYLDAGLPAQKLALTWALYGRRWWNQTGYNTYPDDNPTSGRESQGFYDGLYDTTLRKTNGGPFTSNYVTGDEVGYFTYTEGGRNYTTIHETPESMEWKISAARNFPGTGKYAGVRLKGVGWWSLMWAGDYWGGFNSWNPIAPAGQVSRPAYYRHVDLLNQEILKPPGQQQFPLVSFESSNDHWRDPNESPDTIASAATAFSYTPAPAGAGKPVGTVNAGRLDFNFSNSNQRAFLRYELLNNPVEKTITDTNATLALVSKNTRIRGHYYVSGNYSSRQLRLALVDGLRQMEVSTPLNLPSTSGWHTFQWDLNNPAQISPWDTNEPTLLDGNGVVNTATPDSRDISFLGFIVSGGPAGSGTIYFDELTYESVAPNNKNYVINEYRYANNAKEFVEIRGPVGPFPVDMQLLNYNPAYKPGAVGSEGNLVLKQVSLAGQSVPASGLFVVGDLGVPNSTSPNGINPANWSTAGNDISDGAPGAIQLYGSSSGFVYDSVIYKAFGGVSNLSRAQARRVTGEGYPWSGETATGLAGNGEPHSMGRRSDSLDTNVNAEDFSLMPPTPGGINGVSNIMNTTINFSSVPASAFQSFGSISTMAPATGIPASPNGGNVYRCVDIPGGAIGYFGDAVMGEGSGIDISGELYIPAVSHPAQAIGVGFCGTQGSSFFSSTPAANGYENGYWLIYENGVVNLNDGQPNHNQQFQFVMASNDNQDLAITDALGSLKNLSSVGAAANTWVTFHLRLDPLAPVNERLVARINNQDVYRGPIPNGGRTMGAFMVGNREVNGSNTATKGTWVDNIMIQDANPITRVKDFQLY